MIIDMDLQVINATGYDRLTMEACQETCWIRFIDCNSAYDTGISDIRDDKQLKEFVPNMPLSRYIRICQMGRKRAIRTHRKNLLRHSLSFYKKQWKAMGSPWSIAPVTGYYTKEFSKGFLKRFKPLKLVAIKMV